MCTADFAWANCDDLSSHMDYIIMAMSKEIDLGQRVPVCPMFWRAHKQKRRTPSTLAAETMATQEGVGALD